MSVSDEALLILKNPPEADSKGIDGNYLYANSIAASVRPSTTSHAPEKEEPSVFGVPRWYSTLNFRFENTHQRSPGAPTFWVDNLSSIEQEQLLLQELLYVLCGAEGSLITVQPLSPRGIAFLVDGRVERSLKDLTMQITQLGVYFYNVTHYVENFCDFKNGRVNQALCAAIRDILEEYFIMVSQLETFYSKGELTLQKVWFFIHPTLQAFAVLNSLVAEIEEKSLTGGTVLTVLHEKATSMMADATLANLCQSLAQKASEPYFNILETWIYKGMIQDPFLEFLVVDSDHGDGNMEQSDHYWEKRYRLEENNCPCFLKKMMPEILKAGKYLNVIRECGNDISMVAASRLHYSIHERVYVTAIENAYSFASKTLLDLLLNEYDLMRRLQSVKHYLLMDQGDFIVQFLDLAEGELSKEMGDINPVRLESLLELALRTSSSSADPYKDNVRVQLFPCGIAEQLQEIMSIETPMENAADDFDDFNIPGVEAFAFSYDVQWPISLVLNKRAITCYQLIFRHLFYCKHVERQLSKVWIANKSSKNLKLSKNKAREAETLALCQKMLNFVQNLQYYMAFEVIEPAWHVFLNTMSKVSNVDQVLSCHVALLDSILMDSMLISSSSSLEIMTSLLSICLRFVDKVLLSSDIKSHKSLQSSATTITELADGFNEKLVEFLREVSCMVQDNNQSSNVANIIYRVNFNGFYTDAIEKLSTTNK